MNVSPQGHSSKELDDSAAEIIALAGSNPGLAMFLCRLPAGTSSDSEIRCFARHYPGLKWRAYLRWSGFPDAIIDSILGGSDV